MYRLECYALAFKTGRDPEDILDLPVDEVARQLAALKILRKQGIL